MRQDPRKTKGGKGAIGRRRRRPDEGMDMKLWKSGATEQAAMRLCSATSLVGVPVVAVPTGVVGGMPQGVQVIGGPFREDLCLDAAGAIEERLGALSPTDPRP